MARRIQQAAIRPSLIISSPAVRAWTTAKAVAKAIAYPSEFLQRDAQLYLADMDALIDIVEAQENGFNNILVVAHNPGLTNLANHLCPDLTDNLPTSGVVSVTIDSDIWDLRNRKPTTLLLYDYPKRTRETAGVAKK